MPAYNEAAAIESVCSEWLALAAARGFLLMVIDDGSRDATGVLLDELARGHGALRVTHQPNQGHGAAVLRGYRQAIEAGASWVFQVDSDGQFTPADFDALWAERVHGPCVLGYRRDRDDPWLRKALSGVNRALTGLLFGVRLRDPNAPYRLIGARLLATLLAHLPPRVFAPNVFLAAMAAGAGVAIREVPVTHMARRAGAGSIGARRAMALSLRCFAEMVEFRLCGYRRFLRAWHGGEQP
jgi:glycosyltransferase involved in cell wall biosynthesis